VNRSAVFLLYVKLKQCLVSREYFQCLDLVLTGRLLSRLGAYCLDPCQKNVTELLKISAIVIKELQNTTADNLHSSSSSRVLCLFRQVQTSDDVSFLYHELFSLHVHIPHRCSSSSLSL